MTAKYALVTGANRGIGLDVARMLVQRGKPVIVTARNKEAGAATAEELNALSGAPAVFLPLDASNPASVRELAAQVAEKYDKQIELLVNNAGVLFGGRWDAEAWTTTMATNYLGAVDVTLALAPHLSPGAVVTMVSSGLGQLSNLTSDYSGPIKAASSLEQLKGIATNFNPASPMGSAPPGSGGMAPTYCVSKALLNRAVQLMAAGSVPEVAAAGLKVVSTCPGWCRTRMGTDAAGRSSEQGAESVLWPFTHWKDDLTGSFTRDGEPVEW